MIARASYSISLTQLREAGGQAALITRGRILLDDAPFRGAVDQGIGLRNSLRGTGSVFCFEQTAHLSNLVAQPRLARLVDGIAALGNADALLRGNRIGHGTFIVSQQIAA